MADKSKLRPITDLRDTNKISKLCHENNEPIFITKNGYEDLVIMSNDTFNNLNQNASDDSHVFHLNLNSKDNMVRVGCVSNDIAVGEISTNVKEIIKIINESKSKDLDILVFPELSISGYTCGDLFFFNSLIDNAYKGVMDIVSASLGIDTLIFIGAPLIYKDKLYNCAIAIANGKILGVVPKSNLPNYNEFYEKRQFVAYTGDNSEILLGGISYPFGTKLIFVNTNLSKLKVSVELCEDLWSVNTPSTGHVLAGANVIVNLSASNELYGKDEIRRTLVKATSSRLACAYLYSSAGKGESSQDLVYSGHNIIAENGIIIKESNLFNNELIVNEIDLDIIESARRKSSSFENPIKDGYLTIYYSIKNKNRNIIREISPSPFLPYNKDEYSKYAKDIITLQKKALEKRLAFLHAKNVVLGISGGLDSTLALIVAYETFKEMKLDFKGIHTIIMPGFGTSNRTHNNAIELCKLFKSDYQIIDIKEACTLHLKSLKHDLNTHDVTYENTQARERTQILFDYANFVNGIVIGTGDLSELALGFATFNGDHMSNYGINCSVPKTLVRFLVKEYAKNNKELANILVDILETPISPELLPTSEDGSISQITEDVVGPYELTDFFLYYLLKYCFTTQKIFIYAKKAFKNKYDDETIKYWLNKFIERFFKSQFKRSTLPDGPKVSEVSLSPRGDLRMPSDAPYKDYLI